MTNSNDRAGRLGRFLRRPGLSLMMILVVVALSAPAPVRAEEFQPDCSVSALIAALDAANTNDEADVIDLPPACVYTLTAVNHDTHGPTGLPSLADDVEGPDLIINGHGSTLERAVTGPDFRLMHVATYAEVVINDLTFQNGRAPQGAGLHASWQVEKLTVNNSRFIDNTVTGQGESGGAAIFSHESLLVVRNSLFTGNKSGINDDENTGGAIKILLGDLQVYNSTFTNNSGPNGGAIYIDGANPATEVGGIVIKDSLVAANRSAEGGGLFSCFYKAANSITLDRVVLSENSSSGGGGGLVHYCGGQVHLNSTTVANNTALKFGGGLKIDKSAIYLDNTTIYGNKTTDSENNSGGAIFFSNGPLSALNTTITQNEAMFGGGITVAGGVTDKVKPSILENSIIAHNRATNPWDLKHNCTDTLGDGGNNIQFPAKGEVDKDRNCTGSVIIVDPLLDSLADNGGPNQTVALRPGSPAIDAGNPDTCPAVDQRRYTRTGVCDIGAYEYEGAPFVPTDFLYLPLINHQSRGSK